MALDLSQYMEPSWQKVLEEEWHKPYLLLLTTFLEEEWSKGIPLYPLRENMFQAFQKTPFEKVKVVIIGQDPYHGPGQAHGLSFSVPVGIPQPPSLQNIFKELVNDVGIPYPQHGCLLHWASQGVLLLNALLSVRQGEPLSHQKRGWEVFTDAVVAKLSLRKDPIVFLLWGKSAQDKCQKILIQNSCNQHLILKAPHPSPLSAYAGFLGCRHFSKSNQFLFNNGFSPIDWRII